MTFPRSLRSLWSSSICAGAFSVAVACSAASVRADVVPPGGCGSAADIAPCDGKKAGDACTFSNGSQGNCAALRCTNDAGQTQLQCVATGVPPTSGCSVGPATAAATSGALAGGGLLLISLGAPWRRRRRK